MERDPESRFKSSRSADSRTILGATRILFHKGLKWPYILQELRRGTLARLINLRKTDDFSFLNADEQFLDDFDELLVWIDTGPNGTLPVDRLSDYTRAKKAEAAQDIVEHIKTLTLKILAFAPEFAEEYSVLRILEPWCCAFEPELFFEAREDIDRADSADSSNSAEDSDFWFRRGDLTALFSQGVEGAKSAVKDRRAYGLELPLVGETSIFEALSAYIAREGAKIKKGTRERLGYPSWCVPAAKDLWQLLCSSDFFKNANKTHKRRIIEYTTRAYSDYHGLTEPGEKWEGGSIETALNR